MRNSETHDNKEREACVFKSLLYIICLVVQNGNVFDLVIQQKSY
jgi:hypothetical protein